MRALALGVWAALLLAAGPRPAINGIAHIVLRTDDMAAVRQFYTGVLGYEEVFSHSRHGIAAPLVVFKVNERQYIEFAPALKNEAEDKMIQIGFETGNARELRAYLAARGVAAPARIEPDADGNLSFRVTDPEGHKVEFVEYRKSGLHAKHRGRALGQGRLSDHMMHVGVHVKDPGPQAAFYRDVLGFRLQWQGGPRDDRFDWMSYMTPDGGDWIEFMISPPEPTAQQLGVWHHICLETLDIQSVHRAVLARGHTPRREPAIARDGRWLLHLFDKHNTRTEFMVRKPVEKPCCSPNLDPYAR